MNYIEKLKQETNKVDDMIFKDFSIGENSVTLIYIESLSSSDSINNFILKKTSLLDKLNTDDLTNYLFNYVHSFA